LKPPKARAIAESIEMALRENESDLTKTLMTKEDGAKLCVEIAESKTEVIKWMVLFWIGQMAATAAIIKLLQ
jgi:methyl coenzyme M reductase beta subunit